MAYKNPEDKKIYNQRYYLANIEKTKEQAAKWQSENKEKARKVRSRYKKRNKDKIAAHDAVKWALKTQKIARSKICQCCRKKRRTEAHHHKGYEKENRLDIVWLCRDCHKFHHRHKLERVSVPPQDGKG